MNGGGGLTQLGYWAQGKITGKINEAKRKIAENRRNERLAKNITERKRFLQQYEKKKVPVPVPQELNTYTTFNNDPTQLPLNNGSNNSASDPGSPSSNKNLNAFGPKRGPNGRASFAPMPTRRGGRRSSSRRHRKSTTRKVRK